MGARHIVVIGGGVAGMASALAFCEQGHRVTILEKEALPACDSPVEAFERWERRGSPQSRHSHAFLARLHNAIKRDAPALYDELMAAGAEPLRFRDMVTAVYEDPQLLPEDDEIVLLACRRITFDWVLRRHLERRSGVSFKDGIAVLGLQSTPDEHTLLPCVSGVRIAAPSGEETILSADLVVDASGRNTKLPGWLTEIGAAPLETETESCGIFYCSRFYRLRQGAVPPPMEGPIGADLGYMKYAIFQGDSGIFSITLAASPDDDVLRSVRRAEVFDAASRALPSTRAWVDPAISEPITDVYSYANLKNTIRFFVADGKPLALGLFPVGDALLHANPISGRGCTLAWVGARLLADAFAEHPDDPLAFARAAHEGVSRELVPWYESMRDQDRAANESAKLESEGHDPLAFERKDGTIDPKAYMRSLLREGLMPALREDLTVLRTFMRVFNMLAEPKDVMANPDVLARVLAVWQRRAEREPIRLGPGRAQMIEELRSAAA